MDIEGVIEVKNVWCGCCGKQKFIMYTAFMLRCIHCKSEMKFSYMSRIKSSEWYVYDAPAIPHPPSEWDYRNATGMGIEWMPYPNSDIYHARKKYNCNTGKKLGDEMVIRELKELKNDSLREIKKIEYKIEVEERMGRLG